MFFVDLIFFFHLAVGNIDDEYIRRYIGQLDPFEESCLVQLRKWVAETHKGKVGKKNSLVSFFICFIFSYQMILIYFDFFVLENLTLKKQEKVFVIH